MGTRAVVPQDLVDNFGGIGHYQDGTVVNPHDLTVKGGKIYVGTNPSPLGAIGDPFLAVHPAAATSFAKHVADQAASSTVNSSFGTADDVNAFFAPKPKGGN